ncbi:MAG TPA: DUF3047 domain-containing protein [Usitatibacter sp.]|nr:DUF3047 domain-containing protein [Usitatibacter sp.]
MTRAAPAALLLASSLLFAADIGPAAFSASAPGTALPAAWREQHVARASPNELRLVGDDGVTVLEVQARAAAGAAIHALRAPSEGAALAWRWKVDHVVGAADMDKRAGDDFAARVYVFFDVPVEALPFGERVKIRLARLVYGDALPTAAICYVWDNRHAPGTSRWSPYTDRVRMVVLESGNERAGRWVDERRDLAADFRAAFGSQWHGAAPAVTGVGVGNDTDQTGETVTAWFGDVRLERLR